ncbi:MAG: hypothetical protein Q7S52_04250 [bacterium]|nr:hypothetical protein [bacterium]
MKSVITKLFFLTLFAGIPLALYAHGGGQAVQQESGEYLITLDAVSEQIHSGTAERINFEIERFVQGEAVSFTHVWVRMIDPSGNFFFAGNISAAQEGFVTGMSYLFPSPGTYGITARFLDGERVVAEAELTVPVAEGGTKEVLNREWLLRVLFFVAGLLFAGVFARTRQVNKQPEKI